MKDQDLQAPIATDYSAQRRAFVLIGMIYGLAGLAALYVWVTS